MVFDKVISDSRPVKYREEDISPEELRDHTGKHFSPDEEASALYVYLPGWNEHNRTFKRLKRSIAKRNGSLLVYEFPSIILSSDAERTREFFKEIRKMVLADVNRITSEEGYTSVHFIGASLGAVHASMIADSYGETDEVTLIVPAHDLAEALWQGYRTQYLRKEFEEKDISLSNLKEEWKELAPMNNLGYRDENVRVFISKSDKIIPYECGKKLVDAMKREDLNPLVKENRFLGHYGTVVAFYLFPEKFLA